MFEIVAGAKPTELKAETVRAVLDGAIKCVGRELRHMPACLDRMNGVQLCALELVLCEAVRRVHEHRRQKNPVSLEPGGGSGMPATHCESATT